MLAGDENDDEFKLDRIGGWFNMYENKPINFSLESMKLRDQLGKAE
jgi:hypothetical protein